jgi:alkylated DNA repair dioxygenase AlkB
MGESIAQLSIFGGGPQVLLDDDSGRIVYYPDVVPAARAGAWFDALEQGIAWKGGRRMMYEREVDVPRLRAHFALADADLPAILHEVAAAVRQVEPAPFDSLGLNYYRDRHDSVAPHNDTLDELARGQPIALLSLGATREMVIRGKQPPRRVLKVDMQPGSVLVMSWATQLHYDHGIPKQRVAVGPRISVALRVRGAALRRG